MEEDLERYESEVELKIYKEYHDVLPMFRYVVETERRFYLANEVDLEVRDVERLHLLRGGDARRLGMGHVPPGPLPATRQSPHLPRRERRRAGTARAVPSERQAPAVGRLGRASPAGSSKIMGSRSSPATCWSMGARSTSWPMIDGTRRSPSRSGPSGRLRRSDRCGIDPDEETTGASLAHQPGPAGSTSSGSGIGPMLPSSTGSRARFDTRFRSLPSFRSQ